MRKAKDKEVKEKRMTFKIPKTKKEKAPREPKSPERGREGGSPAKVKKTGKMEAGIKESEIVKTELSESGVGETVKESVIGETGTNKMGMNEAGLKGTQKKEKSQKERLKKEKTPKEKPKKEKLKKEKPQKEKFKKEPRKREAKKKKPKAIKTVKVAKAVKGNKGSARQSGFLLFSIRNKIVAGFLVPVVFMIVIGVSAYQRASEGMSTNYMDSTMQTIDTAAEYVNMICTFIESEGVKYAFDGDLGKYFLGMYDTDPAAEINIVKNTRTNITSAMSSNEFINNIHIVTREGLNMITTSSSNAVSGKVSADYSLDGILSGFREEASGGSKTIPKWNDHHDLLDKSLALVQDDYLLVYEIMGQSNSAAIVIDIKTSAIADFLKTIDLGEGSMIGFITGNGRELVNENLEEGASSNLTEGESVFYGQEFFNEINEENMKGTKEIKYKGEDYLFIYSYSEMNGCTICALVPMKTVTGQAEEIKSLTVGLVILAVVIVVLVCLFIASGIQNNMKRISSKFGEVAKGDLTVQIKAKGHDEFRGLAGSANNMIENTKKLVNKVTAATAQLEVSSREVEEASDIIDSHSKDITQAISDINEGMAMQSVHAQECVTRTDILSNEIQGVSLVVEKVEKLVNETEDMINQGMEIVRVLGDRAKETTEITARVGESINSLRRESEIINTFVETITDISEQTNLLSLNASIEAARAGEAGRGFAVVAEEIRKLADNSAKAAGEVRNNVDHITAQTLNSVENAGQAQSMVALQGEAVEEVIDVFRNMQLRMRQLVDGLKEIVENTERADGERNKAVEAVQNISAIIQETAASTETVNEVANKLLQNVENLNKTADILGENMDELKSEMLVFKI
ncbi:MAG: methyl-accepting chemotaxis protein [Roseburia sp.]|nr:methyl-accepting chemotaxis protein [Roseburia sp.]